MKKTLISSLAMLSVAATSQAALVSITNADFETNPAPDNAWSANDPSGWTGTDFGIQDEDPANGVINTATFVQGSTSITQDISLKPVLGGSIAIGDKFDFSILARNQNGSPTMGFDIQNSNGASLIGGSKTINITTDYTTVMASGTVDTASTTAVLVISSGGAQARFDDVTLDYTVVPEPSSTALLGLGGLALILRRRK